MCVWVWVCVTGQRKLQVRETGVVISRAAAFVSAASRLWQIHRARSIRGLASLATLTADTFHATAVNSSSGVYITNSWRTCARLAGGGKGREACLLCKGSSRFLSFASFFISSSPTPLPLSSHTWFLQEPSSDNTLLPHT